MFKYKRYKKGMEDGFSCIPFVAMCKWRDEHGLFKQCYKCPLDIKKQPYIDNIHGREYIEENDYIVYTSQGKQIFL